MNASESIGVESPIRQPRFHTERTTDESAVDWIIRDDLVQGNGSIRLGAIAEGTPGPLAALIESRVVARIEARDGAIRVWRPTHATSWDGVASQVDTAVHAAFANGPWVTEREPGANLSTSGDSRLAAGVREVLNGEAGEYITSHGGQMTLLDVTDGVITLELTGACKGCPAAAHTLRMGIEARLRARFPEVRAVVAKT